MDSLYEGIRIAQDLCYCREWSEYRPVVTKLDPFGRTTKRVSTASIATSYPVHLTNANFMSPPVATVPVSQWDGALPPPPTPEMAEELSAMEALLESALSHEVDDDDADDSNYDPDYDDDLEDEMDEDYEF